MTETGVRRPDPPELLETAAQHASTAVPVAGPDELAGEVLRGLAGRRFDSASVIAVILHQEPNPTPRSPYILVTGRRPEHYNSGEMSLRTPDVLLRADEPLDVEPSDATALGLRDGDLTARHSVDLRPSRCGLLASGPGLIRART